MYTKETIKVFALVLAILAGGVIEVMAQSRSPMRRHTETRACNLWLEAATIALQGGSAVVEVSSHKTRI